ncbi:hypothetical protein, partial [Salmonella enterica]|uniref:hypothetical protein n=1 Tax=Salmonella enterica TaxID=28901 RepID=UPI003526542F
PDLFQLNKYNFTAHTECIPLSVKNSAENDTTAMQKTVLFSHCGDIPPKNGIFPYYLRSCSIFMFLLRL